MRLNRHDAGAEAKRVLALAWPVILTSLNWTLLQIIDVAIVGHAGTAELGALAAARSLGFVAIVMGLGALSGVLVVTARDDGAGCHKDIGRHLRSGIIAGALVGLLAMVILLVASRALLNMLGVPDAIAVRGVTVVTAMALGFPGLLIMAAAGYFLEGISRPARVTAINLFTLPVNAALAWALVGGHAGLAPMGAVGGAAATSIVNLLGAVALLVSAWKLPDAAALGVRDLRPATWRTALREVGPLMRFGMVPAFSAGFELAGFSWLIALSTRLGAATAAAFQTAFSLHNLLFGVALGFASAAGVRAGNAAGAGEARAALPRTLIAVVMAVAVMGTGGGLMAIFSAIAVAPFSNDPAVLRQAQAMLAMLGPFMLFDGVQLIFLYALRSLGDQIAGGINSVLAYFVVTGGLGAWLVAAGWGGRGLVVAMILGMVAAAVLQGGRMIVISCRSAR